MNACRVVMVIVAVSFIISGTSCGRNRASDQTVGDEAAAGASTMVYDNVEAFRAAHPAVTASWDSADEEQLSPTGYGGSVPFQRWELLPEITTNFDGIAFSKDYKEDRGHVYAWEDLFETERTGPNSPGACLTCKTSDIAKISEEFGWEYASMKLDTVAEEIHAGIDCFACHDPAGGGLRVVQPAFIEAMTARGVDLASASSEDMRVYTCAQCHSEYYFEPGTKKVIHPWKNGTDPEEQFAYYQTRPGGFEGDFTHGESDTRLIKAQHPDYEEYATGIHAAAGVTCAHCHMPRVTAGSESFALHKISSPLKSVDASCLSCHVGKSEKWMIDRVRILQDAVYSHQRKAGTAIQKAHQTISAATEAGVSEEALTDARKLLREGQWYWDFTASANSMGFHNSHQAHDNLSRAHDLAWRAIEAATRAAGESL